MGERANDSGTTAGSPGEDMPQPGEEELLWTVAAAMRRLGPLASMAQIAREAGLSPAALYRRFPTPDLLRERLAEAFYERLLAHARQALSRPADQRLRHFLGAVGLHLALGHGVLPGTFGEMAAPGQREHLYALAADLLEQCKEEGVVSADVALSDLVGVVWGLRGVIAATDGIAPDAWERYLDVAVAGLRNPEVSFGRPPLGPELLDRVITRPSR
ncbi:TetR/AcrR family transcriptional regulator [Streptomyces sp. NPDC006367]|uniref:TetR/AcrR family transcriptional regulator n=1 Tax=unclassified Streptomyces TaxID=2593676 RepID=UPI0033B04755